MVRKCSAYLTSSVMGQVIHSLFFCHLYYCPVIWSTANKSDLNKLELVQSRAARLTGYMHTRLSWLSVEHKLLCGLLRNIIVNQTPDYFHQQLLKSTNTHNYNARKASIGHLALPTARTNNYV